MSRPLVLCASLFLAGILVGLRFPLPGAAGLLLCFTAAAAYLLLPGTRSPAALVAFVAAGVLGGQVARDAAAGDCRARLPDGAELEAQGVFAAPAGGGEAAAFQLEAIRLPGGMAGCRGAVRARLGSRSASAPAGAGVVAWGRWQAWPAEGPWPRPGTRAGSLLVDSLRVLPGAAAPASPLLAARGRAQQRIRSLFPGQAALAEALLLAQTHALDPEVRDRFARSGLAHLLSISGFHVGLIAATLLLLGGMLRLSARSTAIGAAVLTAAYVLFLGAPYAASRAALQVGLLLAARLLQRPADPYALLATAALVLLAIDPLAALDVGFQLSFAGVAGLLALRRRLLQAIPGRRGRWVRESVATSLAATLATAPLTVLHFGQVAPIGMVANLLAVPLAGAAVPALALALAAEAAWAPAGRFLAGGAVLLLHLLDALAARAAALPGGGVLIPRDAIFGWALAAGFAAVLSGWLARRAAGAGGPGKAGGGGIRAGVRGILATGVAAALLVAWPLVAARLGGGALEIHVIDVGQGDAIAIRSPAGRWLLVDAGPRSDRYDAGRARVVPFLLRHGARRLEALILTHPDADHIGGAASVLRALPVGAVIDPGLPAGKPLYLELLREARDAGIPWAAARAGREIRLDDLVIRLLHPGDGELDGAGEANEVSVAFGLEYGRFAALFLGDAPAAVEEMLVARFGEGLRSGVLKVAHHGSATSTTEALLGAVRPGVALIPVGRHNRYGHPDPAVLKRLRRHGARILRTDLQGTITLRVFPDGRMETRTSR